MKLFTKLDAAGAELPDDATNHAVLIDHAQQILIDVRDDIECTHYEAPGKVAEVDLAGRKDWRMPTPKEQFNQAEHSIYPAFDPNLYPNTKRNTRYWTSTVAPEVEDDAFAVYLDDGDAGWLNRSGQGVVRAVCPLVPPPGQ